MLSACGGGTDIGSGTGWHFQGRDCLSCHNVDLTAERHLTVGGTLFLSPAVNSVDDLNNACNASLRLQFLDAGFNVVYDSVNYDDPNSKGYNGRGNLFILARRLASLQGLYFIRVMLGDGTMLAQSGPHSFTSSFDKGNPADLANRYSCNSCHSTNPLNGAPGLMFATLNSDKCK